MKRLKLNYSQEQLTFKDGFKEYINNCISRNLRLDSIIHYKNSYKQIIKYLDENINLSCINKKTFDDFIINMKNNNISSSTLYIYARDLSTIIHFFQRKEYTPNFRIILPKVDKKPIETYSDEDLSKLLKKPNMKNTTFSEYRNYCIVATFLSLGIRVSSLINIKIKDVNFDDEIINITHTKNRKQLILPMPKELIKILKEYIKYRQNNTDDDYLFCTVYGKKMSRNTITEAIEQYNKRRGVNITSIHRFRHTFAKKWIIQGKSVVTLQKVLGHTSLQMTQNYINILVPDLKQDMQDNNILQEFTNSRIKMR